MIQVSSIAGKLSLRPNRYPRFCAVAVVFIIVYLVGKNSSLSAIHTETPSMRRAYQVLKSKDSHVNVSSKSSFMSGPIPPVVALGAFFTRKPDAQRPGSNYTHCFGYIQPWYESIHNQNMHGVLLYDDLSDEFIKNYTTSRFRFVKVNTSALPSSLSTGEWRLYAYMDFLLKHEDLQYVSISDVSDVIYNKHPLEFFLQHPQKDIFFAYEDAPHVDWMEGNWKNCFQEPYKLNGRKTYAVGIYAGKRKALLMHLFLVNNLLNTIAKYNGANSGVCDMLTHHKTVHEFWKMDPTFESRVWEDGQPLYNKIKTQNGEPGEPDDVLQGYYIVHRHRPLNC